MVKSQRLETDKTGVVPNHELGRGCEKLAGIVLAYKCGALQIFRRSRLMMSDWQFNAVFSRKMRFTIICRNAVAMLSYKASRLLRNFIFACYGLPAPVEQENVPFSFFPTRQYSRSRALRK